MCVCVCLYCGYEIFDKIGSSEKEYIFATVLELITFGIFYLKKPTALQGSRNPLARSPRRVLTMSGLVESQELLVRRATNVFFRADNFWMPEYHKYYQRHLKGNIHPGRIAYIFKFGLT